MKYTSIILLLLIYNVAIAQNSLLFESKIYFEDASGKRDTIEIGYDTIANDIYNPTLGESDLKDTFNPDFEVRASHSYDWDRNSTQCILSKRIIGSCEKIIDLKDPLRTCYGGEPIIFFIKTKNQPVKIFWDKTIYDENIKSCIGSSFFTPDYNYHVLDPLLWILWPNKRFACAGKEDEFIVNLDPQFIESNYPQEYTFSTKRKFSNKLEDTILGVELNFEISNDFSPCQLISQTDTYLDEKQTFEKQFIYPNPASNYLLINNSIVNPIISIMIFDQSGRLLEKFNDLNISEMNHKIDIEELEPGIYYQHLKFADQTIRFSRFLKL
jgi:Secretion system C-terminal sorting domain